MAALFALVSAILFGAGDFFGGLASRRTRVLVVVAASHVIGLCLIVVVAPFMADTFTIRDFLLGSLAGVFGCLGIACLYHSLGRGPMAVAAPITAVGSAVFPVLWGVLSGDHLTTLNFLGILIGLAAIVLVSSTPGHVGKVSRGLVLEAMLAGAGFGGFLIALDATDSATTPWPLVAARLVSVAIAVALVLRSGGSPVPPFRWGRWSDHRCRHIRHDGQPHLPAGREPWPAEPHGGDQRPLSRYDRHPGPNRAA